MSSNKRKKSRKKRSIGMESRIVKRGEWGYEVGWLRGYAVIEERGDYAGVGNELLT